MVGFWWNAVILGEVNSWVCEWINLSVCAMCKRVKALLLKSFWVMSCLRACKAPKSSCHVGVCVEWWPLSLCEGKDSPTRTLGQWWIHHHSLLPHPYWHTLLLLLHWVLEQPTSVKLAVPGWSPWSKGLFHSKWCCGMLPSLGTLSESVEDVWHSRTRHPQGSCSSVGLWIWQKIMVVSQVYGYISILGVSYLKQGHYNILMCWVLQSMIGEGLDICIKNHLGWKRFPKLLNPACD